MSAHIQQSRRTSKTKITPQLRTDWEQCHFTESKFRRLLALCAADPKGPRTFHGVVRYYIRLARNLRHQLDKQLAKSPAASQQGQLFE